MAKKNEITVNNITIRINQYGKEEYLCLTDIAKNVAGENGDASQIIQNWMRTRGNIDFLGTWEVQNDNEHFNQDKFKDFLFQAGAAVFTMSPKKWIESTNAIGIISQSGRYGGTYAHRDIALAFCYAISPAFQIYLIKEFQRLKADEAERFSLEWNVNRLLSKVNYRIQADAIKRNLIPFNLKNSVKGAYYASEADLLNVALFGMTAKEWRNINPEKKGNLRDNASFEQLIILANLETHNAEFIKDGLSQDERLEKLNEIAIYQMQLLVNIKIEI